MKGSGVVDDGVLEGSPAHDVGVLEALLHPAVALRVERGAFGGIAHRARSGEDDLGARRHETACAGGIGNHQDAQVCFDQLRGIGGSLGSHGSNC